MIQTALSLVLIAIVAIFPHMSHAQVPGLEYRHENLPKVFEMLIDGTPVQSTDYEAILDWVGKVRELPFRGTPEEAARIKASVDQLVESRLSYGKLEAIDSALHITGALDIYKDLPAPGRYYNIFSRFDSHLSSAALTLSDLTVFNAVLKKAGWTLEKLKAAVLHEALEYTATGEIYNGFPKAHLSAIASSHMRSGLAYGPPGSVQIPGLFTTAKRASSLEWGQTKARGLGFADFSELAAALLVIKLSSKEPVFNVPDGELKRPIIQLGYEFASLSGAQFKKLSPYARHILKLDDHGMSALMVLTAPKSIEQQSIWMPVLEWGKSLSSSIVRRSGRSTLKPQMANGSTPLRRSPPQAKQVRSDVRFPKAFSNISSPANFPKLSRWLAAPLNFKPIGR